MALQNISIPDMGDFGSVEIIEILVAVGDRIAVEDSLITVESDKASMEIPSSHAGVVTEIKIALGDSVAEGAVIVVVEASESTATAAAPEDTVQKIRLLVQEAALLKRSLQR